MMQDENPSTGQVSVLFMKDQGQELQGKGTQEGDPGRMLFCILVVPERQNREQEREREGSTVQGTVGG
jgi:hypothetical protein